MQTTFNAKQALRFNNRDDAVRHCIDLVMGDRVPSGQQVTTAPVGMVVMVGVWLNDDEANPETFLGFVGA